MKIWLFALLQSIIAGLGLAAFFLADNVMLATAAAVMAAILGIAQPIMSAHKERKMKQYQDKQWDRSVQAVDEQLQDLLKDVIEPPLPHRATVLAALKNYFGNQSIELIAEYDQAITAIEEENPDAAPLAAQFSDAVDPWSVGPYLQGLAALQSDNLEDAHQYFCAARESQSAWILPWLGWATVAYHQGNWDEIRQKHPHINGVELLPYDAGDEASFLELSEQEREELSSSFQQAATSLGNYYAIAEYCHSKVQMAASREEYNKVA